MPAFRAAWLCPIDRAPLAGGWVAAEGGRITDRGDASSAPPGVRDLGHVVLMPGLVNAHTHLELSWLRGKVPPAASFVDWVKQLFLIRGAPREHAGDERVLAPMREAIRELHACGTVAVGDVGNSLASVGPLTNSALDAVVFHELLGFKETDDATVHSSEALRAAAREIAQQARRREDTEARSHEGTEAQNSRVRISVAPHAPYSVSAELFQGIRAAVAAGSVGITSVHLAESESELALLRDGSGPWPGMLRVIGAARDGWMPPQLEPVEYLDALNFLDERTLVVHGVCLSDRALERLAARGCTLVTCPRSNQWVGVGVPPLARFYRAGVKVAVGTDSLASNTDLNLFNELAAMHWMAPEVPARTLLDSATRIGARGLEMDDLGTLSLGARAQLLSVTVPAGRAFAGGEDVEDYLVSGIAPEQLSWVAA